jgi:hypothetical protein
MHRRLGPALRMGPNEVHVYDPDFYHKLYFPNSKFYKDPSMHKVLGAPTSTLAESDPVKHKQRKAPLEPLFAKKNMHALEPMLMAHVDHCCRRFDEFYAVGKPVSMEWALKSLAMGAFSYKVHCKDRTKLTLPCKIWFLSSLLGNLWERLMMLSSSRCRCRCSSNICQVYT